MARQRIPEEVLSIAHARSRARAAMDWAEADRLRAQIEAAGWRVVDRGIDFALSPAHPPNVETGGRVTYGASASVPSLLEDAPAGLATIVLAVAGLPDSEETAGDLQRSIEALRRRALDEVSIVVAVDQPGPEIDAALASFENGEDRRTEVIRTTAALGVAAAMNAGVRRAAAAVVILVEPTVVPTGDFVTPLVRALEDPTVAVAGPWGSVSTDLRRWGDAPPGEVDAVDVDIVDGACLAFRRSDYVERGPLDEKFSGPAYLAAWWSLVLRDEGEGVPPRRAVAIAGLAIERVANRPGAGAAGGADAGGAVGAVGGEREVRRNFYRLLDRFGSRRDLLLSARR